MKTLNWKRTDWTAKNIIFTFGQEIIGQLSFNSNWSFNAVYTDNDANLQFTHKHFWDRDVIVWQDGKAIGDIRFSMFSGQTLKLYTGEKFFISTSFWEQEVYLKNESSEILINYQQAIMSSLEKGCIKLNKPLTNDMERLLLSSGLFIQQAVRKQRIWIMFFVLIPIFTAAGR